VDETTAFILELQHINEQQDEDEEETPHSIFSPFSSTHRNLKKNKHP